MYNAAIIGAGQLGSRHLQALKTASLPFHIWVVDNSEESLNVAKQRYEQVTAIGEKEIELVLDINQLPEELDFVVVATGSKPRAVIVKGLLNHSHVKNMILEKVLFPRLEDYDEIGKLINEKGVKCWVNCARRMFGVYHQVIDSLSGAPIDMKYEGTEWGLCCNSIHIIDLFMLFSGEDDYSLDTTGLIPEIEDSKRSGYIEFYGTLKIQTPKGSTLTLTCSKEAVEKNLCICIQDGANYIEINEASSLLSVNGKLSTFRLPYQSETTGTYADMIMKMGYISLSTFEKSVKYHKEFISKMLEYYNSLLETKTDLLPIT